MSLNNAGMTVAANALRTALAYGQLHFAPAGDGTSNLTTAARQALSWTTVTGDGDFTLAAIVSFTGGAANGPVYSLSFWSAAVAGTCYGEVVFDGGSDPTFNATGGYEVTAVDFNGWAQGFVS